MNHQLAHGSHLYRCIRRPPGEGLALGKQHSYIHPKAATSIGSLLLMASRDSG